MGLRKIENIVNIIIKLRNEREPVAVIENGTTENQRVFTGELKDLVGIIKNNNVTSPVVIVIGEVVKFREYLWKFK